MFHRGFKHSKTIKALGLRPHAFISFLVFETPMKHSHSFLKYFFKYSSIFSTRSPTVIFSSSLSSRNFSTSTTAWFFPFILGATNFPLFMAGSSSANSISCRQVVDIHKPSAYRFRPLVVPLQTNF